MPSSDWTSRRKVRSDTPTERLSPETVHLVKVVLDVVGGYDENRVRRCRENERPFVVEHIPHDIGHGDEEAIPDSVSVASRDGPSDRVQHHLPDQRSDGEDADAALRVV